MSKNTHILSLLVLLAVLGCKSTSKFDSSSLCYYQQDGLYIINFYNNSSDVKYLPNIMNVINLDNFYLRDCGYSVQNDTLIIKDTNINCIDINVSPSAAVTKIGNDNIKLMPKKRIQQAFRVRESFTVIRTSDNMVIEKCSLD